MSINNLLNTFAQSVDISDNRLPQSTLDQTTLNEGLQIFFAIGGAVALLIITIGALKYVLSRGDSGEIKKAKETIIYASIGLIVMLAGYSIVVFVFRNL